MGSHVLKVAGLEMAGPLLMTVQVGHCKTLGGAIRTYKRNPLGLMMLQSFPPRSYSSWAIFSATSLLTFIFSTLLHPFLRSLGVLQVCTCLVLYLSGYARLRSSNQYFHSLRGLNNIYFLLILHVHYRLAVGSAPSHPQIQAERHPWLLMGKGGPGEPHMIFEASVCISWVKEVYTAMKGRQGNLTLSCAPKDETRSLWEQP